MGQSPAIISESSGDKESSLCIHAGYYFVGGFSEGSKGVPQGEVLWYHSAGRIHRGVKKKVTKARDVPPILQVGWQ